MTPRILIIGEVYVDVTLTPSHQENKMRLGGIVHAVRALWAIQATYDVAYIAPSYLTTQIESYCSIFEARSARHIGTVDGSPNVFLISEATEAGPQGYELLLREEHTCSIDNQILERIVTEENITDIIIFPGGFDLSQVLNICHRSKAATHIDIANSVNDITILEALSRPFETIILSTSSPLFLETYQGSVSQIHNDFLGKLSNTFLFKENRGGARFFDHEDANHPLHIHAQVRPVVHSVGVGDCYDVVFVMLMHKFHKQVALTYASWIAAEYASTTYPDDFKTATLRTLAIPPDSIIQIQGVTLPWEERTKYNIYIAAPDFDFLDRTPINRVAESLRYHNFTPRLPIRENGQLEPNATPYRQQEIFASDMRMLGECHLLLAVLINNDPGTLIEVGLAAGMKMPVIVYDPYRISQNPMLTQLPQVISSSLDTVIAGVFTILGKGE